jgi:hypothetical protein
MLTRVLAGLDAKPLNQFSKRRLMMAFEGIGSAAFPADAIAFAHGHHPSPILCHLPDGGVQP